MIHALQKRFALSEQGARDLIKGCLACLLQDLSFMFPVGLLYFLVLDLMNGTLGSSRITFYAVGVAVCLVLIFICAWFQYNATYLATYRESGVRRIALAEKLRKIPLSFFSKKDLADLTKSIMDDCATLEQAFSHFVPQLAGSLCSTVFIGCCLFAYDWRMALAAVWVLPIALAIVYFSAPVQEYFNNKSSAVNVALETGVQEYIEAMADLKSNNAEGSYFNRLSALIDRVEGRQIITELCTAIFVTSSTAVLKFGIATVALVGSTLLIRGEIDIPLFFMFLLVASRLYAPLEGALQNLAAIISTRTNIGRMNEILFHPVQEGSDQLTNDGYDIVFDHVGFAYDGGETVLEDVSFTAKQGEVTALIGPSGCGKTTASRLAARFWDASRGRITVGGMDVSTVEPETLLTLYSIVFQDVTLFNNTVMENIRIGRKGATDEEVMAAARRAGCEDFINKLPDGYQSLIGENGCELSGGERQRLSIARAFLKDAPIILLDEATASLDVENENLIQEALSQLIQDKTVLIIAHRMRTISAADNIVVLSGGVVAETGTPAALMQTGTIYPHMVRLQQAGARWQLAADA
ncbi:MAG: ABC transporter ATP-binding protein [Peptococcaceae bacterium]|nr:ABC transporter ATP-binding protein [Peptococcaceae bacterium]